MILEGPTEKAIVWVCPPFFTFQAKSLALGFSRYETNNISIPQKLVRILLNLKLHPGPTGLSSVQEPQVISMHINVWEASFHTEWVRQTQEETEARKCWYSQEWVEIVVSPTSSDLDSLDSLQPPFIYLSFVSAQEEPLSIF